MVATDLGSHQRKRSTPDVVAVDLFCGAGGKTYGLRRAGISVVAGVDNDPFCRFAYEHNNRPARFIQRDIAKISPDEVASWYPVSGTRVLIGCTPCQPFSSYSYRYAENDGRPKRDGRWGLLHKFRRLALSLRPEIITVENVPELALLDHSVYSTFVSGLGAAGYHVSSTIVKCADYGVPQTRERLVLLASLLGPIDLIPPTHPPGRHVTVRKAIGHLPPLTAGGAPPETDALHRSCRLSAVNLERIRSTPEGGSWRDWPERLRLKCHLKESGKTYPSVYGRMSWDKLAPTLTTQCYGLGNGRFGHPDQDRAISLREAALIQTFPKRYKFAPDSESITFKHVGRQIGNAVPARLGEVIGTSIVRHLTSLG